MTQHPLDTAIRDQLIGEPALVSALEAVLDLHQPFSTFDGYCCRGDHGGRDSSDAGDYPCKTVQALAAALGLSLPTTPERTTP